LPSGEWRVKGTERDKMLNLGLNHMIACANLNGEDALAIMGDSLFSAPSPRNFRSTLTQVENVPNYYPDPAFGNSVWRFSRTAENYPADTSWISHVNVGYNHMYSRNQNRLNGVHSFLTAAETCINHASKIAGINYMCDHTIIDSYVQVAYLPTGTPGDPCYELSTYQMANQLNRADHFMTGNYVLLTSTPSSGGPFQDRIDQLVAALRDASRGIRDNASSVARFWAVLQTQDSPDIPQPNHFRTPTQTELLCSVNLALAHGAKGIDYYLYAPVTAALDPNAEEYGLLDANLNPRQQYYDAQSINTNYQGTGQSLATIGGNFLDLTWREGISFIKTSTNRSTALINYTT
jgi:hypothetical protein